MKRYTNKKLVKAIRKLLKENAAIITSYTGRDWRAYRGQGQCTIEKLYEFNKEKGEYVETKKYDSYEHYDRRRDAYYGFMIGGDKGEKGEQFETLENCIILGEYDATGTHSIKCIIVKINGKEIKEEDPYNEWEDEGEIEFVHRLYNKVYEKIKEV